MKKLFLLLIFLSATVLSAKAVDWVPVDTDLSTFYLYIDMDTVKNINPNEYLYAIKFQSKQNPEKVVFIKSNLKNNYIGVIKAEEFDENNYYPKAVFTNAHVFMKPVESDSFLSYAHNYLVSLYSDNKKENNSDNVLKDAFVPEADKNNKMVEVQKSEVAKSDDNSVKLQKHNIIAKKTLLKTQSVSAASNLEDYVSEISCLLNDNWQPPKSGQNTQTIVILTIGNDGSLQKYDIAKSSGDEATDRSIISAAEKSVPYAKFSGIKKDADNIKLQFVFEYKKFKKSVI